MKQFTLENTELTLQGEASWEQNMGIESLNDEALSQVAGGWRHRHEEDDWSWGDDGGDDWGDDEEHHHHHHHHHCHDWGWDD